MTARTSALLALVLLTAAGCGQATSQRGLPDALPGATAQATPSDGTPEDFYDEDESGALLPPDRAFITALADGCTVYRSSFPGAPPDGLLWQVLDEAGKEVALLDATRDNQLRYDEPGVWGVQLVVDTGSDLAPVSNRITIDC